MFRYYVYIETKTHVYPLIIYAHCKNEAYKKAVKKFKNKFVKVTVHRDYYYFGGFEY